MVTISQRDPYVDEQVANIRRMAMELDKRQIESVEFARGKHTSSWTLIWYGLAMAGMIGEGVALAKLFS